MRTVRSDHTRARGRRGTGYALSVAGVATVLSGAVVAMPGSGASTRATRISPPGGTLTIADTAFPSTMDPAGGQNAYNQFYDLAYSPLIYQNVQGKYVPDLATAWAYGPKNESFSFTLRPNVHFSDGTLLTAAGVKAWIEHELKVPGGAGSSYLSSLTTIKVTSPLHLTLYFSKPTPQLPLVFSEALEMGLVGSPKAISGTQLKTTTDGAGAYVLNTSGTVFGSVYTYTPNPHFWNPSGIHWKKVVIRYISSPTTTLQAMQSGQVQVAVQQTVASIAAARGDGFNVTKPMQAFYGLSINDRVGKIVPALAKLKVREALNYAIDRAAINKAVFAGQGAPNDEPAIPGDDGYVPALATRYGYNPTRAKQLLTEAGYPHGFTMHILDVNGLNFNVLAEAVAGELAKVGITAIPETAANIGDYFGKLASGKYEVSVLGFGGLPSYFDYKLLYGPDATQFNPLKTRSSTLDSLYQKLLVASEAKAVPFAQAMTRYVTEQAWFVVADSTPFVAFSAKSVGGITASGARPEWYLPDAFPMAKG